MKKVLFSIIIITIMLITISHSVLSEKTEIFNQGTDKIIKNNYKDYLNCKIKTSKSAVDGRAFLFPGCLLTFTGGGNIKRASGKIIAFEYIMGNISFNNDTYYGNWIYAFVFSFNGYIHNYYDRAWQVFDMDGIAKFARVYYS